MTYTVTQEDRDAAIYFLKDRLNHNCSAGLDCLYYIEIGLGQADRHVLVQAFARHRIEALERAAEAADAKFSEAWKRYVSQGYRYGQDALENVQFGYRIAQEQFAAAIRNLKGEANGKR